jgi:dTDP-4-amino-4,6-dideoxygalactose transaminase
MKVPLLDIQAQIDPIRDDIKKALAEVVDSGAYILGPKVQALEVALAEYIGVRHAVAVSSGTDALLLALMAIGVGPGDLVLTSPYSFFATAGVVARLNATPVFVDIDPETYNLDPALLADWFENHAEERSRVKAVIPVHLYGQCADMDAILAVCDKYGVPIVEDAAQAIGSRYPSKSGVKQAGSMGKCGCFSFYPSKNLGGMGEGGLISTDDDAFAQKLRWMRNHGQDSAYYHTMIGGNFRLDGMQGAVLLVKFPLLEGWHAGRRKNAAYYDAHLKGIPGVKTPRKAYGPDCHIYNQYIVLVERRDALREFLSKNEIGCAVYYPVPFHLQPCFEYLGYKQGDFPRSETAADHTLALPIYAELTTEMQEAVVAKIAEFCSKS